MTAAADISSPAWLCPGTVLLCETAPGPHGQLSEKLREAAASGCAVWDLDCDFRNGGLWAGIRDLFGALFPEISQRAPELLARHDYELVQVLPLLKRTLRVRNPNLTDVAPRHERVRNYPADRCFRIVHGIIDLLAAYKEAHDPRLWVLGCGSLDRESHIGRRFFRELVRRRAESHGIVLVATAEPDALAALMGDFGARAARLPSRPSPHAELGAPPDLAALERELAGIEEQAGEDAIAIQHHLPDLIRGWRTCGRPEKLLHWLSKGQSLFNILGFYEDALVYGYEALDLTRSVCPGEATFHFETVTKLFSSHLALGQPQAAFDIAHREIIGRVEDPYNHGQLCYLMAMLHARFMPQRDLATGERYLEEGLASLLRSDVSDLQKHFEIVFNRNGLAMIRHFQKRFDESLELCRSGYEQLNQHLHPEQHRLHRSVLLYNIAQVYAAMGYFDQALSHYAMAMEMDPNYSEYYNDRGGVYLKLGRLEDALGDFRKAIDLSPPYHEVWTNLGQCYRLLERFPEAIEAYSAALDLEPGDVLALLGRAQSHEESGDLRAAVADYAAALELAPEQWEARANRAALLYELGEKEGAVADLTQAIAQAPEIADLYQNRSLVLAELGLHQEAAADLRRYEELS